MRASALADGPGEDGPLRVLLTTDFYHPHIGGAERQVRLLAAALAQRGHAVRVATASQPGLPERDELDGVPLLRLRTASTAVPWFSSDQERRFLPPVPDPALTFALRREVRRFRPDVVHASGWIAYSSAAAVVRDRAALLISVRDYGYACAVRSLLHEGRRLCSGPAPGKCLGCAAKHYGPAKAMAAVGGVFAGRPLLSRTVRGVHSVSRFVEWALRRDLATDPLWAEVSFERIPDIVPPPAEAVLAESDRILVEQLPSQPFILFVGALQPHKGLAVLLRAHATLRRPPSLVLIGTRWPDTPESFPAGVTVLSDVPHAVVMEAWRRARFGVAPSVWPDPLPGVVREGMASGRPVIGSRVGGIPDMIEDGVNGLLVEPGDDAALAAAMQRLIDDPPLAGRLAAAGLDSLAELGADAVASRFEALYRRVRRDSRTARQASVE